MIQINQGTNGNECVFTLNEQTTIAAPINYLFSFTKIDTNVETTFMGVDITWNRCIFNLFNIELVELVDIDLYNSKLYLSGGRYKYIVYQQNSSANLDPLNALGIVEKGFVDVQIPIIDAKYDGQTSTWGEYDGNL